RSRSGSAWSSEVNATTLSGLAPRRVGAGGTGRSGRPCTLVPILKRSSAAVKRIPPPSSPGTTGEHGVRWDEMDVGVGVTRLHNPVFHGWAGGVKRGKAPQVLSRQVVAPGRFPRFTVSARHPPARNEMRKRLRHAMSWPQLTRVGQARHGSRY